jgi:lipopolysaccharide/colanic/teichoic acid biosynthesis glycosyltransferase
LAPNNNSTAFRRYVIQIEDSRMATLKTLAKLQHRKPSITNRVAEGLEKPISKPLSEELFLEMLKLEQRRTERSGRAFLLMLVSGEDLLDDHDNQLQTQVSNAIASCVRETDVLGWYRHSSTLGLIITEIGDDPSVVVEAVVRKTSIALQKSVSPEVYCRLAVVVHMFPKEGADKVFQVDFTRAHISKWIDNSLKRAIDVIGSLTALIVLSPLFLAIAIAVKCTSEGPIFFCRKRLGKGGKEFCFYKFRTMWVNNDPQIHHEFVSQLITGSAKADQNGGLFKMKNDPRITPIGRFLRRTSLDELPQFFNVLMNDMSLVGPRPPLPYEYEKYCIWHKRRVLDLKPGITGLWQVEARSLTTFDEMVRIDIRYACARNLWLDLRIMLQTPGAMFSGRGAC